MFRHTDSHMLSPRTEPTLLSALKRHWRLAAAMILALCVLLVVLDLQREAKYVSSVDIILREPAGGAGFDAERYANDQVSIMASAPVSSAAIEILKNPAEAERDPINISFAELTASREIIGDPFSNRITVTYTASDPVTAVWAANSIVDAYDQTVRQASIETAKTVRDSYDDFLAEVERQLIEIDRQGAEASGLESERASLVAQQANFLARISDLNVEAALNSRPIALRPDIVEAERLSLVNARSLIALALLGIGIATGIAYLLDRRSWAAMHPNGPPQSAVLSRAQMPALQPGKPTSLPVGAATTSLPVASGAYAIPATHTPSAPTDGVAAAPPVPVGIAPVPAIAGATALTAPPRSDAMFAPPASPARPLVSSAAGGSLAYDSARPTANDSFAANGIAANGIATNGIASNGGPPPIQRLAVLSGDQNLEPTLGAIRAAGHQVVALVSPAHAGHNSRAAVNLAVAAARANFDVGFVSSAAANEVEALFRHLEPGLPPTDGSVWAIPVAGGSAVRVMNSMQSADAFGKFVRRLRGSLGDSAVGPALLILDLGGLDFVTDGSKVAAEADASILVLPNDSDAESERVYRRFLESKRAAVLGVVQFDGAVGALGDVGASQHLNGDHRGV